MNTGQCPSNSISGYQFDTHYDCVTAGYAVAQRTYKNLLTMEEYDLENINKNKLVIKFECKGIKTKDI
jgi:hypothetical protein